MKQIKNYKRATVCDLETDGLLESVSKIYICGYKLEGKPISVLWGDNEEDRIRAMLKWHNDTETPIAGHNFQTYDIPVLEKLYKIDLSELMVIDTLGLSWYLNVNHQRHSLEVLAKEYDVPEKFDVDEKDWANLTKDQAIKRVTSDVAINTAVYKDFITRLEDMATRAKEVIDNGSVGGSRTHPEEIIYLDSLVGISVEEHVNRILTFLMFKGDVLALQERTGWLVDVPYLERSITELEVLVKEAADALESVMPKIPKYAVRKQPSKPYRKNGDLSASGENWERIKKLYKDKEVDDSGTLIARVRKKGEIEELVGYNPPNINGHQQVKDFLFSHGWKPETFKYVRDDVAFDAWIKSKPKSGAAQWEWSAWKESKPEDRGIPQIRAEGEDGKELCESVEGLAEKVPEIRYLEEYSVIKHRLDTMKGILERVDKDGKVQAGWHGLCNTLRVKHRAPVVNLPAASKKYAEAIRGCLVAPEGFITCGSDLSSLEDRVKVMFMMPHDPEYAELMCSDRFDPHLVTAVAMGGITEQQMNDYIDKKLNAEDRDYVYARRTDAKPVNYLSVYGGTSKALILQTGWTEKRCKDAIDAYWEKNWAVKKIADEQIVVTDALKLDWLVNPINGFCYSVRSEKDRFSTLAQGTGSFLFDMWIDRILTKQKEKWGKQTQTMTYHDEGAWVFRDTPPLREAFYKIIKESLQEISEEYILRRHLDCEVQFGKRYCDIH